MCERPKMPKIHDYNRDKMGIIQKRGRLEQKTQGNDFRYVVNFAMIAKFRYHRENTRHSENSNFCYAQ